MTDIEEYPPPPPHIISPPPSHLYISLPSSPSLLHLTHSTLRPFGGMRAKENPRGQHRLTHSTMETPVEARGDVHVFPEAFEL